jgi:hypothetical protein
MHRAHLDDVQTAESEESEKSEPYGKAASVMPSKTIVLDFIPLRAPSTHSTESRKLRDVPTR